MAIDMKVMDDWYSELDKPDPKTLPSPCGWRVVIRPDSPAVKSAGGIIIPISNVEQNKLVTTTGRVLAIGPLAYSKADMQDPSTGEFSPWCSVGDTVLYGKYAGIKLEVDGVRLLILNDDEVIAVTKRAKA